MGKVEVLIRATYGLLHIFSICGLIVWAGDYFAQVVAVNPYHSKIQGLIVKVM